MAKRGLIVVIGGLVTAGAVWCQSVDIQVGALDCLPVMGNSPITVRLEGSDEAASVRLYFRRFNPLGSFYYTDMALIGSGTYGAVFPRPENRAPAVLRDGWWTTIASRDWLEDRDQAWLGAWLKSLDQEPAEYFIAVHDPEGERLARTAVMIVQVRHPERCQVTLSQDEQQWAASLSVGETTGAQADRSPFHWSCEGIVERIAPGGEREPHASCLN